MSSRLQQLAAELTRRLAGAEFKRTSLGQLLTEAETLRSRKQLSGARAQRLSRRIASATPRNVTRELLAQLGLPDVEKYDRGAGNRFLNMLGPLGKLIRSLGRPKVTGQPVGAERELAAAMNLLRAFGYKVLPPDEAKGAEAAVAVEQEATQRRQEAAQRAEQTEAARRAREVTREVEREQQRVRETERPVVEEQPETRGGPLTDGEMIPVRSSNVHSFGYLPGPGRTGTLLVRFLAGKSDNRSGPGRLYEYRDVPVEVFDQMALAQSKGKFVWDELRVRGTIAGHQYSYDLAGVGLGGYVPRQAAVKRGQQGTYFIRRRLQIDGVEHTSSLREQRASRRGPGYTRKPAFGIGQLELRPNRGEPNRGRP